jgi:hypothetical protein
MDRYEAMKQKDKTVGIYLLTAAKLGDYSARLIVGSSGPISISAARDFVFASTDNRLMPHNDTFRTWEEKHQHIGSIFAHRSPVKYKETSKLPGLVQVSANSYLDHEIGTVWEKTEIGGKEYFVRQNEDDIKKVLEDVTILTASIYTGHRTTITDFIGNVEKGNVVNFFTLTASGKAGSAFGKVIRKNGDNVLLRVGDVKVTVPLLAVNEVIDMPTKGETPEDIVNYLKKAFISEDNQDSPYVQELEKMLNK